MSYDASHMPQTQQPGLEAYAVPPPLYHEGAPQDFSSLYQGSRLRWAQYSPFRRKRNLCIFVALMLVVLCVTVGGSIGVTHNRRQDSNISGQATQVHGQTTANSTNPSPIASLTSTSVSTLSVGPSSTASSSTKILNTTNLATISGSYFGNDMQYRIYYQTDDNVIRESARNSTTDHWFQSQSLGAARRGSPIAATITGVSDGGWTPKVNPLILYSVVSH